MLATSGFSIQFGLIIHLAKTEKNNIMASFQTASAGLRVAKEAFVVLLQMFASRHHYCNNNISKVSEKIVIP